MYPNDDDAVMYLFSLIISKYGFDWLEQLQAQQDVMWVRGAGTAAFTINPAAKRPGNQRVLSFTGIANGVTVAVKIQPQAIDQMMAWYQHGAIFASTPRPESARLFLSWLLSVDYQRQTAQAGTPTPLNSLNAEFGLDAYAGNVSQVEGYPAFVRDRPMVEWWRFQIESTLGPPQGTDPAVVYNTTGII